MNLIVFEGLSGAGKTTLAKRSASLLNAPYLPLPQGGEGSRHQRILEMSPPQDKDWANMVERYLAINTAECIDWKEHETVVTEGIWSPLFGVSHSKRQYFLDLLLNIMRSTPALTFFINVTFRESVQRRLTRERLDNVPFRGAAVEPPCFDSDWLTRIQWLFDNSPYPLVMLDGMQPLEDVWSDVQSSLSKERIIYVKD